MKFSVVIPTYGRLDLLTTCIKSLRKFETDFKKYEIIVVDDFSTSENREKVNRLSRTMGFKLVTTSTNVGFPTAANVGMKHAQGDFLVLCNNDIEFTRPVLDAFEESHTKRPKAAVIGCKLFYPNGAIQHGGVEYTHGIFHHTNGREAEKSRYCISVTFALISIPRAFYRDYGGLSEEFFIACDDSEYCLRAWNNGWEVFYDASISAIHAEGATRGRTLSEKQTNKKWMEEERASIQKLKRYLGGIDRIKQKVQTLNQKGTEPLKVEIGCGYNPQPGFEHIDARALPDVDHVLDFSTTPLPYANGAVDEILSNHSIEHISYRKLPFVITEWFRVLRPGGRVLLRTPDLRFICESYLKGNITPEWPDDERFIRNQFGDVTPAWWTNIKLYAGQDYPGNFHNLCFDFEMLKSFLERYGFDRVKRLDIKPVFSPGELQVEAYKKIQKPTVRIKRTGALGDVILTTPLIQALSYTHEIHVTTGCPQVMEGLEEVASVNTNFPCDRVIDLDLAYEKDPKKHIIDAYADFAGAPAAKAFHPKLNRAWFVNQDGPKDYIVLHAAKTWENRTLPFLFWKELAEKLKPRVTIAIGAGGDAVAFGESYSYRNLTIHEIASLISKAKAFIGNDSGVLHIAATTSTPTIGLFTCAKGEYRMPRRKNAIAINTPLSCGGCLHDEPAPVTFVGCKRGDFACTSSIKVAEVVRALERLLADPVPDSQDQSVAADTVSNGTAHRVLEPHSNTLRDSNALLDRQLDLGARGSSAHSYQKEPRD